jgi:hypothetical protein
MDARFMVRKIQGLGLFDGDRYAEMRARQLAVWTGVGLLREAIARGSFDQADVALVLLERVLLEDLSTW